MPIHTARFTPAPAGNMLTLFVRTCPTKVHPVSVGNMKRLLELLAGTTFHPRIRGEYICPKKTDAPSIGSPSHPRGISVELKKDEFALRFTPAFAGNMDSSYFMRVPRGVHPRIRGEYYPTQRIVLANLGSPPHPRGIFWNWDRAFPEFRFTPASAGNIGYQPQG